MGFIHILIVVLGVTTVALMAKLSARSGVPSLDLSAVLFVVSTVLCGGWVAGWHRGFPMARFTPEVLAIAAAAGAGGAVAVFAFNHAVRLGHFGFSNAIYRSSFLTPVVVGVLYFGAPLHASTVLGIVLVLTGVFLMSWSADSFRPGCGAAWRWFCFILLAFLLSGLPRLGQLLTSTYKQDYLVYLFLSYAAGALVLLVPAVMGRRLDWRALGYGSVAAVASVAAVFCTLKALERLPAPVVFPITLSGPVILGLLLSLVVFRETIRPAGWAGVLAGLTGITILGIWK